MSNCYGLCEDCAIQNSLPGEIVYEIHVTVDPSSNIEIFKETCQSIGVKPINFGLFNNSSDLMTSSVVKPSNQEFVIFGYREAFYKSISITSQLISLGFNVIRSKIETVPWNPIIKDLPNSYGESHLYFYNHDIDELKSIVKRYNGYISKNLFKDENILVITLREYSNDVKLLIDRTKELQYLLEENSFVFIKSITEQCVFDSNLKHDDKWIQNGIY